MDIKLEKDRLDKSISKVLEKIKLFTLGFADGDCEIEYKSEEYPIFTEQVFSYQDEAEAMEYLKMNKVIYETAPSTLELVSEKNPYLQQDTHYIKVNKVRFEKLCLKCKKIDKKTESKDSFESGGIELDIKRATLKYKNNRAIPVTPQNKEILFLKTLMSRKGEVVGYKELAKEMSLMSYNEGVTNKDVSREVQDVRKRLVILLTTAGMRKNDIEKTIILIKNTGYKINSY